jgi:hypothetical protein
MQATSRWRLSGDITIPAGVAATGMTQAIFCVAQADRHDLVGVLQGHEDKLAGIVESHVRWGFRCGQAGDQPEVLGS